MGRLLSRIASACVLMLALVAPALQAQMQPTSIKALESFSDRIQIVEPELRAKWVKAWDDHNPRAHERLECVTYQFDRDNYGRRRVELYTSTAPKNSKTSPTGVLGVCPAGTVHFHTHPPTSCDYDSADQAVDSTCTLGGLEAYQCGPTLGDMLALLQRGEPFGVVQCDRNAIIFYYSEDLARYYDDAKPQGADTLQPNRVEQRARLDTVPQLPTVTVTAPRFSGAFPDSLFKDTASMRTLRIFNYSLKQLERQRTRDLVAVLRLRDSLEATRNGGVFIPPQHTSLLKGLSYTAGAAAFGYTVGYIDRDAGGYTDDLIPHVDKQSHYFGHAICARELSDRLGVVWGTLACTAMGAAVEKGQSRDGGYASWRFDFPYDIAGALTGSTWSWLKRRHL